MKRKAMKQSEPASQSRTSAPKATSETTFSDHIGELRRRIFFVLLAFIGASSFAYHYREDLMHIIIQPLAGEKLVYLTPGGGFNFIFQISLYTGLIAAAPVFIYQLYEFIRPALPTKAQRSAIIVVLVAFLLMTAGVVFGYFVAIPSALHFLSAFAGETVAPNLTADSYLSFFLAYVAGLGVLFELPLLLLFLHWIHPMTPGSLLKSERFVVLFAFIAAALITPTPDVMNQAMIAVPLIAIYQLGVIVVLIAIRRERKQQSKAEIQPLSQRNASLEPPHSVSLLPQVPAKKRPGVAKPAFAGSAISPEAPLPQISHSSRRTIDGFSATPRPKPRLQPPSRPQGPVPIARPRPQVYRRSLSIDGLS